ncbi:MAG TPA: hypothetical protein VFA56_05175 [Gaiellaceae bacterium]|nr:hypothetical protein [Gaiellaceae bacterium]
MSGWLDPLRLVLADADSPITFFFRDDDAGWRDDRLHALLDVFAAAGAPIDLAVIPVAVSPELARALAARRRTARIGVHQHGFLHANHEPTGRKCEFGPSRSAGEQLADIGAGRRALLERLDLELDPIFTPPWNRCTQGTLTAVRAVGLQVLSRDADAEPLALDGLEELPVSVDWLRRRRGVRITARELGELLAGASVGGTRVGVMLHHAVMGSGDRDGVEQLLALLADAPAARLVGMNELAGGKTAA